MKSVLLSVRPKWCELIASEKKTIEVRKTAPKEVPFKCYIYCTKAQELWGDGTGSTWSGIAKGEDLQKIFELVPTLAQYNGKVIGEFVCDRVIKIEPFFTQDIEWFEKQSCLKSHEIVRYLNGFNGYGWHIYDLKIYDKPKELREFQIEDKVAIKQCKYRFRAGRITKNGGWIKDGCFCTKSGETEVCENCLTKPLSRPPQSWCYVEELRND